MKASGEGAFAFKVPASATSFVVDDNASAGARADGVKEKPVLIRNALFVENTPHDLLAVRDMQNMGYDVLYPRWTDECRITSAADRDGISTVYAADFHHATGLYRLPIALADEEETVDEAEEEDVAALICTCCPVFNEDTGTIPDFTGARFHVEEESVVFGLVMNEVFTGKIARADLAQTPRALRTECGDFEALVRSTGQEDYFRVHVWPVCNCESEKASQCISGHQPTQGYLFR